MTAPDPARMVALAKEVLPKLTKAQRDALLSQQGTQGVCRSLRRKGLAARINGTGMAWIAYPEFTNLGWAVRQLLLEEAERASGEVG